jgi:hypothetical protein
MDRGARVNLRFAYLGQSELTDTPGVTGQTLSLAPNLAREPVAFDAALRQPLRFREALSALHDVVISDLRYKPRDKTAYQEWKKNEERRLSELRRSAYDQAKRDIETKRNEPFPPGLEREFTRCRKQYWNARQEYANYLFKHDRDLWRQLMPCDPVITVADDVVFFECFSADESSYGCLTVDRDAGFGPSGETKFGTTNVDYSWGLFDHFQSLRSYRETRFRVDPAGFSVATAGRSDFREEKIDLPPGWLRGFMQIQAAMGLPAKRVTLGREPVYSLLAFLKRHKAQKSPRALRFELRADQPPALVLEPWEQRIPLHGDPGVLGLEPVRIWGRQRLLALARVLPLADRFDVYLLGTGLPSFWLARMGGMTLTLGMSGWTANDWTRSSALDLLAPVPQAAPELVLRVGEFMQRTRRATFAEVVAQCGGQAALAGSALNHLAHTGQLIHDLAHGVTRWRQIMPMALGEEQLGPENPESVGAKELLALRRVTVDSRIQAPAGGVVLTGVADHKPVEILLDSDGRIKRGRCLCGHHQKAGLRMGPCRHLLALRMLAWRQNQPGG